MVVNPSRADTIADLRSQYEQLLKDSINARRQLITYALVCVENGETINDVQQAIGIGHNLPAYVDEQNRIRRHRGQEPIG